MAKEIESIDFQDDELVMGFVGSDYQMYIRDIINYPRLSDDETFILFCAKDQGDESAREKLINSNLRLVVWVARRYHENLIHLKFMDMIQEGNIALMKAVEKYDVSEGVAFSTYAVKSIKRAIRRAIYGKEKEIYIPEYVLEAKRKYLQLMEESPNLTDEEIKDILDISDETLKNVRDTISTTSMNAPSSDDKNASKMGDFIHVKENGYNQMLDKMVDFDLMIALKDKLKSKSTYYYVLYYRILCDNAKTLEEIGQELNVTRERIRQIESKAKRIVCSFMKNKSWVSDAVRKIKKQEGAKYEFLRPEPISVDNIVLFLYMQNRFDARSLDILRHLLLGKYVFTDEMNAKIYRLSLAEYREIVNNLQRAIEFELANEEAYESFKEDMIVFYGKKILDIQHSVADYGLVMRYFENLTYNEFVEMFSEDLALLPDSSVRLLQKYFLSPSDLLLQKQYIEQNINLTVWDYNRKNTDLSMKKLYQVYLDNKDSFSEDHQLFMECFMFGKKSPEEFYQKYPNHSKISKFYLQNRLEKMYYNLNKYFWGNEFTRKEYMELLERKPKKLTEERIGLLNRFYGVNTKAESIVDIAESEGVIYEKMCTKIRNARMFASRLYHNLEEKKDFDVELYTPYILNPAFELVSDVRKVLYLHIIEG
ncbi:MAG: sigma-70 family RNA polymerase sigma factor, partial [Bacilli bacterium]|nr:sigma-70 family RNA polymerase sigma factor [Bacilli bacterium]